MKKVKKLSILFLMVATMFMVGCDASQIPQIIQSIANGIQQSIPAIKDIASSLSLEGSSCSSYSNTSSCSGSSCSSSSSYPNTSSCSGSSCSQPSYYKTSSKTTDCSVVTLSAGDVEY